MLETFLRNHPPTFKGRYDPDGAQKWLKEVERIFRVMQCSEVQKVRFGTLKLDISKACDRLDWEYLRDIMVQMGFSAKWVQWIMLCIENVNYTVLVNGVQVGPIIPGRGIQQGDPLSPYLFILCAEGLSALIRDVERRGAIKGTRICTRAPTISHLLFADDCFLFFGACDQEAVEMKNILTSYEAASGQSINLQKLEMYCSRNTPLDCPDRIATILGVKQVLGTGKYLGLSSMIGWSKKATFKFVKDRIWNTINSWSSRCLSQEGREILIKSVLQYIPSYVMSVFLLPGTFIKEIENMLNAFWWGHNSTNSRGLHWLSWERLLVPKIFGGMGFKSLRAFNLAMIGKQAWKMVTNSDALITKLLKAKYYPHSDFFSASLGHNPSYVWRSLWNTRDFIKRDLKWSIGTGENISEVQAMWDALTIAHLFKQNQKVWNDNFIHYVFDDGTTSQILQTPLLPSVRRDTMVWRHEKNGLYSVRSAYRDIFNNQDAMLHHRIPGHWNTIWKLKLPPKVKNFIWRICRNCLPTRMRLIATGVDCPNICVVCFEKDEHGKHLFFECGKSASCWQRCNL